MTAGDLDSSLLGRIVRPADYVRVLATPMRLRSPHFAVHHLAGRPLPLKRPMARVVVDAEDPSAVLDGGATGHAPVTASLSTELSTGDPAASVTGVDDSQDPGPRTLVETPMPTGGLELRRAGGRHVADLALHQRARDGPLGVPLGHHQTQPADEAAG